MQGLAPSSTEEGTAVGRPLPVVAESVTHRYGPTRAVDRIDLVVRRGQVVGLVGPNGSGKTTTLHVVAGLLQPSEGCVTVCGAPAGSLAARRALALVPDDPTGLDELTVAEYLVLTRRLWEADTRAGRRAEVLLDGFGIGDRRDQRLGALSRGLRRRVAVVAALQLAAPVTLVDEATATLDPEAVAALRETLRGVGARGGAVLLATQDLHFAAEACDEVVLLVRGAVRAAGPPVEICRDRNAGDLESVLLREIGSGDLGRRLRDGMAAL